MGRMKVGLVMLAVVSALVCLTSMECLAADTFPAGDSLFTGWQVDSGDTSYTMTRIDELGDSMTVKVKMNTETAGRDVSIWGPYSGLRANAYQWFAENKLYVCGIRDTAMWERIDVSGGDGAAFECSDSTWYVNTVDGILVRHAFVRSFVVGPSANHDTLHLDVQREVLWRRNDPYYLVRYHIKSNEADAAVAGKECDGMATTAAAGDTVQVTASCVTADSTLCRVVLTPLGVNALGDLYVSHRWDGGFTVMSDSNETVAIPFTWSAKRLGHEGDSLRFVFYGAPAMGYASGEHDVGYMPHYGEVRRDRLFSYLPSGPFAGFMNIGNKKAAGDTIADGTTSYMDADSLKKDLGVGRSQFMVGFVAFNPNADIVPTVVAFDDSVNFAQRLPYDSTFTIADTTSAYDHADRYVIFRTDPVYLDGVTYQTLEYGVGIGCLVGETSPVRPTFPVVIYMDGEMYHPANTRRIWHD